jgi:hypothetical protein
MAACNMPTGPLNRQLCLIVAAALMELTAEPIAE